MTNSINRFVIGFLPFVFFIFTLQLILKRYKMWALLKIHVSDSSFILRHRYSFSPIILKRMIYTYDQQDKIYKMTEINGLYSYCPFMMILQQMWPFFKILVSDTRSLDPLV